MTPLVQRQQLVALIEQARSQGARLHKACAEVGISVRTWQRWHDGEDIRADGRPEAVRPAPANKLSEQEHRMIIDTCMQPRFADMPPTQIVPMLADEGRYLASESSFYRILHQHDAQHHRGRTRARAPKEPPRRGPCAQPDLVLGCHLPAQQGAWALLLSVCHHRPIQSQAHCLGGASVRERRAGVNT